MTAASRYLRGAGFGAILFLTLVPANTNNDGWLPHTDLPTSRVFSVASLAIAEARVRALEWGLPAEFVAADEVIFHEMGK